MNTGPEAATFSVVRNSRGKSLLVVETECHNASLPIPESLTAEDIPAHWVAFLRQTEIGLTRSSANRWEQQIAKALELKLPFSLTINLAPGLEPENEDLFRIRSDRVSLLSRRGCRLEIAVEVNNMEFVPKQFRRWIFTVWFSAASQASAVTTQLAKKNYSHVMTGRDGVKAILACNRERWESVGLTSSLIETLAQAQRVSLRCTFRVAATRLSYRAAAISTPGKAARGHGA